MTTVRSVPIWMMFVGFLAFIIGLMLHQSLSGQFGWNNDFSPISAPNFETIATAIVRFGGMIMVMICVILIVLFAEEPRPEAVARAS